jgi:hypothetical protein
MCNEWQETFAEVSELLKHIVEAHGFEYEPVDLLFETKDEYEVFSTTPLNLFV